MAAMLREFGGSGSSGGSNIASDSDKDKRIKAMLHIGDVLYNTASRTTYNEIYTPWFAQEVAPDRLKETCQLDWNVDLSDIDLADLESEVKKDH